MYFICFQWITRVKNTMYGSRKYITKINFRHYKNDGIFTKIKKN